MSLATHRQSRPSAEALRLGLFNRIVVGVDKTPETHEAIHQALELLAPSGTLTLVAAYRSISAAPAWGYYSYAYTYPLAAKELKRKTQEILDQALAEAALEGAPVEGLLADEDASEALMRAAQEHGADLVVVGCHSKSRARGIIAGSTMTRLLHRSPVPVLVARPELTGGFKVISVGVDGSLDSERAYRLSRLLASALSAELHVVAAQGGKRLDLEQVKLLDYDYETSPDDAVAALVQKGADSDLLVVGSRGLHGLSALGSVSERVAHQAPCSVLVVR